MGAKQSSGTLFAASDARRAGPINYHDTHTSAQIAEAREHHLRWLATVSTWLRVDETKVLPDDRKLVDRVMATLAGDGAAFERALADQKVNHLFARGVLYFGQGN